MTRRTGWTVAVLALALTACGSDAAPATSTVSPAELKAMLLTVDDLEGIDGGWTVKADTSTADLGSLAESPCPDVALDQQLVARLKPTDGVIFEPGDGSLRGIQQLILTGNAAQLKLDLDTVFGNVESCVGVQYEVPDSGEKVEYDLVDVGELGDQRSAATITAFEPPEFTTTWRGHTAIVRVGAVVIMLNEFEILKSPDEKPTMTDEMFTSLLTEAVSRLGG
jgi:hypothetical protein